MAALGKGASIETVLISLIHEACFDVVNIHNCFFQEAVILTHSLNKEQYMVQLCLCNFGIPNQRHLSTDPSCDSESGTVDV